MAKAIEEAESTDKKVVRLDERALTQLVSQYRRRIYGYLVRCGIPADARDDLFQEVFLKAHKSAATYRGAGSIGNWVFAIAANTVRSHYRKRRVRDVIFAAKNDGAEQADDNAESPDARAEANQTAEWLEQLIAKLPLTQREVVNLCCVESLPHKEVAQLLGMNVNTVKTNLHRARLTMTKALAKRRARLEQEGS